MTLGQPTCDVCGEELPPDAYFCGECGASVPEFGPPAIDSSSSRSTPPPTVVTPVSAPDAQPAVAPSVQPPAPLVEPPVLPTAPPAFFTLTFSTGERAQIVGRGLVGRMPVAAAGDTWDHLIVVSDDSRTVSKTHLQVEATPEGLIVVDLGSANGTVVSMPGIAAERLAQGERVLLQRGATVGLGDQSFTVS